MPHVLLETPSPRARYAARHVLGRMVGRSVTFAASREELRSADGPKLYYGPDPVEGAFPLAYSGYFDGKGEAPSAHGAGEAFTLFPMGNDLDVLAAAFHLLALEEDREITARDAHGRVPADELLLVRAKAHEFPVIDHWALRLDERLRTAFPQLPEPARRYGHTLTVDVDNGLKYAARSLHRALGAFAKDIVGGRTAQLTERWQVRAGRARDPYAAFVDRIKDAQGDVDRTIAFVLVRGEGRFDHAARTGHRAYTALLRQIGKTAEIGLHPSYESSRREELIPEERDLLAAASGHVPTMTRQHFLRWRLPDTFRALIANGFTEDHSIGFSDRSGFRAGTCTAFPWYDLEREEETALTLHPFAVMDSAVAGGTGEGLRAAIGGMKRISDQVRAVRGTFISVWHDRFLSGHGEFLHGPDAMAQLTQHAKA